MLTTWAASCCPFRLLNYASTWQPFREVSLFCFPHFKTPLSPISFFMLIFYVHPFSGAAHLSALKRPWWCIQLISAVSGLLTGAEYWEDGGMCPVCWYELQHSRETKREHAISQHAEMPIRPPLCAEVHLKLCLASWGGSVLIWLCLAPFERQESEWGLAE